VTGPTRFADLSFAAALATAKAAGKLLLVDARGALPADAEIPSTVLAVRIDPDADPQLAQQLKVEHQWATVIAFREGVEVDRSWGAKTRSQVSDWLAALERGQRWKDTPALVELDERRDLARRHLHEGQWSEALGHYLWVWDHMLEIQPTMYGVRHSFLKSELTRLISADQPSRLAFTAKRDVIAPPLDRLADESIFDWFTLNDALGDGDATLAWWDACDKRHYNQQHLRRLFMDLVPLFVAKERWAEVGATIDDGVADVVKLFDRLAERREELPHKIRGGDVADLMELFVERTRDECGVIVRGLRAAGRGDEANATAAEARRRDPSPEMATAVSGRSRSDGDAGSFHETTDRDLSGRRRPR